MCRIGSVSTEIASHLQILELFDFQQIHGIAPE